MYIGPWQEYKLAQTAAQPASGPGPDLTRFYKEWERLCQQVGDHRATELMVWSPLFAQHLQQAAAAHNQPATTKKAPRPTARPLRKSLVPKKPTARPRRHSTSSVDKVSRMKQLYLLNLSKSNQEDEPSREPPRPESSPSLVLPSINQPRKADVHMLPRPGSDARGTIVGIGQEPKALRNGDDELVLPNLSPKHRYMVPQPPRHKMYAHKLAAKLPMDDGSSRASSPDQHPHTSSLANTAPSFSNPQANSYVETANDRLSIPPSGSLGESPRGVYGDSTPEQDAEQASCGHGPVNNVPEHRTAPTSTGSLMLREEQVEAEVDDLLRWSSNLDDEMEELLM